MPTDAATLRRQAEERARKIVAGTLCPDSGWYNSPDDLCAVFAIALLRERAEALEWVAGLDYEGDIDLLAFKLRAELRAIEEAARPPENGG